MNTYTSTETVKARKITAKDGEVVVTQAGPQLVPQGHYVTDDSRVIAGDEFESKFKKRRVAKPKAKAKPKPEPKTETKPTADPAERVAAARARKSS